MDGAGEFDRWYAAKNAKIVLSPSRHLETFGNTLVNYRLVSELPDRPGKVRVREGRLEAHRPLVIAPDFSGVQADGFSEEARAYLAFLREHEDSLRILRYGYHLRSDNFSEQVVTDSLEAVTERVVEAVKASDDPFAAVLQGVDDPWDVALIELWRQEVQRSTKENIRELNERGELFGRPV
jgi:hypothetical protein